MRNKSNLFCAMIVVTLAVVARGLADSRTPFEKVDYVKRRLAWYAEQSTPPDNIDLENPDCVESLKTHDQWVLQPKSLHLIFGTQDNSTNLFSFSDNCEAFDFFLTTLGTNDCKSSTSSALHNSGNWNYVDERQAYRGLFILLKDLNYTNACSHLMELALNPRGIMRTDAIQLAIQFGQVNDSMTDFVGSVVSNSVEHSVIERGTAYRVYAKKIVTEGSNDVAHARAASMFYQNREFDWKIAYCCDAALLTTVDDYATSSNRLNYAIWALDNAEDRDWNARNHFITVTNQLLSSGLPLQWIDVGGNNP